MKRILPVLTCLMLLSTSSSAQKSMDSRELVDLDTPLFRSLSDALQKARNATVDTFSGDWVEMSPGSKHAVLSIQDGGSARITLELMLRNPQKGDFCLITRQTGDSGFDHADTGNGGNAGKENDKEEPAHRTRLTFRGQTTVSISLDGPETLWLTLITTGRQGAAEPSSLQYRVRELVLE